MSRKRSVVWQYFKDIDGKCATCEFCGAKVFYKTSTSNLKRHLAVKHPNENYKGLSFKSESHNKSSSDTPKEQKREKKSPVWRYFENLNGNRARCFFCEAKISFQSSTSNLKRHLDLKHRNINWKDGLLTSQNKRCNKPKYLEIKKDSLKKSSQPNKKVKRLKEASDSLHEEDKISKVHLNNEVDEAVSFIIEKPHSVKEDDKDFSFLISFPKKTQAIGDDDSPSSKENSEQFHPTVKIIESFCTESKETNVSSYKDSSKKSRPSNETPSLNKVQGESQTIVELLTLLKESHSLNKVNDYKDIKVLPSHTVENNQEVLPDNVPVYYICDDQTLIESNPQNPLPFRDNNAENQSIVNRDSLQNPLDINGEKPQNPIVDGSCTQNVLLIDGNLVQEQQSTEKEIMQTSMNEINKVPSLNKHMNMIMESQKSFEKTVRTLNNNLENMTNAVLNLCKVGENINSNLDKMVNIISTAFSKENT